MVSNSQAQSAYKVETSFPIAPQQTGDNRRENATKDYQQVKIPTMLPLDESIPQKVRYVCASGMKF